MSESGEHEKQTLAPPAGSEDVYAAPTLAVHRSDSDIERLLEAARDDSPVVRITIPPRRRMRRMGTVAVAIALGLLAGALVAWWLLTR